MIKNIEKFLEILHKIFSKRTLAISKEIRTYCVEKIPAYKKKRDVMVSYYIEDLQRGGRYEIIKLFSYEVCGSKKCLRLESGEYQWSILINGVSMVEQQSGFCYKLNELLKLLDYKLSR